MNQGDQPETFELRSEYLGLRDSFTVPAHSIAVKQLDVTFKHKGANEIDLKLTDSAGLSSEMKLVVRVQLPKVLNASLDAIAAKLPALEALLVQSEAAGIATDYERVNYSVISRFIGYGRDDVTNGELDRADYVIGILNEQYDEAVTSLNAYLSGTRTPKAVPRYVTGPTTLDRYAFIGDTVVRSTYAQEQRPVFFNGYGHFAQVRKDIPNFQDLGANLIQIEIGPRNVIFDKTGFIEHFQVNRQKGVDADAMIDSQVRYSGTNSLRITNRTPKPTNLYLNVWQRVAVKPDTVYVFKARVKGENAKNVWFPGGAGWSDRYPFPENTNGVWKEVTVEYRTKPGQTEYDFTIVSENAGTVWVDDLVMTEKGTTGNLLMNGDFERTAMTSEDRDYVVSTAAFEKDILNVLNRAQEHDVAVNLLLSPHYFPDWVLEDHPELASKNGKPNLGFVFDHPRAKRIIQDYLEAVIPLIQDHPALHSVTLTNEPQYQANRDEYNKPGWTQHLEETYGTIGELNQVYGNGTSYGSFAEVPMPPAVSGDPAGYDYAIFNNKLFSGWQEWMADIIHNQASHVRVHAKIMAHMDRSPQYGIDVEQFSAFSDLNGNDNFNWITKGAASDREELAFYDLQASLREVPIFNSEQHVIVDKDAVYGPEYGDHIRAALWQGAVHGKSASTLWIWERTYNKTSSSDGSILHRPESVAAVGHVNHDLNRLSREVTALQNADSRAAILYSMPSLIYSPHDAHSSLLKAYEALSYTGEKVSFVSEQQMNGGGWQSYDVLIVPNAGHVHPETLAAVRAFQAQGGKVVIYGENSLLHNVHNEPLPAQLRTQVLSASLVIPAASTAAEVREQLYPVLENAGLAGLKLMDTVSGKPVYGVEWRSTIYNGRLLLNVMNDTKKDVTASIKRGAQGITPVSELIESQAVNSSTLVLKPNTPYLFDLGPASAPAHKSVKPAGNRP